MTYLRAALVTFLLSARALEVIHQAFIHVYSSKNNIQEYKEKKKKKIFISSKTHRHLLYLTQIIIVLNL